MSKAVYFGAGTDFHYIQYMPEDIEYFYLIDSQPFSEFGTESHFYYDIDNLNFFLKYFLNIFPFFKPCFLKPVNAYSRKSFIVNLKKNAIKYKLNLISEDDNKLLFRFNQKNIIYFINTAEPKHLYKIANEIENFDHIMIMGYCPDKDVLNYTNKKPEFWSNLNTFLGKDNYYDQFAKQEREDSKITYLLNYNYNFYEKFSGFNIIDDDGNKIKFENWDDLLLYRGGEYF